MGTNGRQLPGGSGSEPEGATEPITLTDPDGAVTRVAPWSSWTREQVRAPGGEPALVTRLDQGQLWFAAGRKRSPWHHEVHVGPAIVSTPRGRFHATAEADGGATIACLAGRTRVVAGLREPVLLSPEQSASVSSDGRTLVVMDRPVAGSEVSVPELADIDLRDREVGAPAGDTPADRPLAARHKPVRGSAGGAVAVAADPDADIEAVGATDAERARDAGGSTGTGGDGPAAAGRRDRWGWLPEVVAIGALVALLLAAVVLFGRPDDAPDETADRPTTTAPITSAPGTTAVRTTTTAAPTTTAPRPTAPITTTSLARPPAISSGATAVGTLRSCRRSAGGVTAIVHLSHRTGPGSKFQVTVRLIDGAEQVLAKGQAVSGSIAPDGEADVVVPVRLAGAPTGACELFEVTPV